MRKSNVKRIVCILLFTFLLSSCKYANGQDTYISFTLTFEEDGQLLSEVYYFNLEDEEVHQVAVVPYTSQYPLTVYEKKTDLVYYTARIESEHKDEVYAYSPSTKKTKQLTDSVFAISYIIPYGDHIFLAAVPFVIRANDSSLYL